MSDELKRDVPPGYRILNGCHNCAQFRDLNSYDGFDGYCAAVQPIPLRPPMGAKQPEVKRFWKAVMTRKVTEWAICDNWEAQK